MQLLLECMGTLITGINWAVLCRALGANKKRFLPRSAVEVAFLCLLSLALQEPQCSLAFLAVISACSILVFRETSAALTKAMIAYVVAKGVALAGLTCGYTLLRPPPVYRDMVFEAVSCGIQLIFFMLLVGLTRIYRATGLLAPPSFAVAIGSTLLFSVLASAMNRPYVEENQKLYQIASHAMLCLLLIIVLWLADSARKSLRFFKLEARIDDLVRIAHRYKALIPSVEQTLVGLQHQAEANKHVAEADALLKAAQEITVLRKDMGIELQSDFIRQRMFETTGLLFLDNQILFEQAEALQDAINLEVVIGTPVPEDRFGLSQLELQRIVGDLIQNARNCLKESPGRREMMLMMRMTQKGYRIRVCDSGPLFPPHILNHIGERGLTTNGTGHGLPDVFTTLEPCGASLTIEEYPAQEVILYTKAITVTFNGLAKVQISSCQPEVTDTVKDLHLICARGDGQAPLDLHGAGGAKRP